MVSLSRCINAHLLINRQERFLLFFGFIKFLNYLKFKAKLVVNFMLIESCNQDHNFFFIINCWNIYFSSDCFTKRYKKLNAIILKFGKVIAILA